MARRTILRTDYGTIALHWLLVALVAVSLATGLRIAILGPSDSVWLRALDSVLPQSMVWTAHIPSGLGLFGLALAYIVYMARAGLARRIAINRVALLGPRLRLVNVLLCWLLLASIATLIATGGLMYFGRGGSVVEIHRCAAVVLAAGAFGHVATHWAIGGAGQLARMVRPRALPPPVPPLLDRSPPLRPLSDPERSRRGASRFGASHAIPR